MIRTAQERAARKRYKEMVPVLDEQGRRRFAAMEAQALGRGGVSLMSKITGLARRTIYRGISDLRSKWTPGQGVYANLARAARRRRQRIRLSWLISSLSWNP